MDPHYLQIKELSEIHIDLCNLFIQALNDGRPAEELSLLKTRIRRVLEQIEQLEQARGQGLHDKDNLPA
ncbi:MAG TPA: hypothetical protein VF145_10775 [Chitinophagaceae bacterium]